MHAKNKVKKVTKKKRKQTANLCYNLQNLGNKYPRKITHNMHSQILMLHLLNMDCHHSKHLCFIHILSKKKQFFSSFASYIEMFSNRFGFAKTKKHKIGCAKKKDMRISK